MLSTKTIQVTPLSPSIGAEIGGIDLTKPLDPEQVKELHDALMEHLVVFFRDQHVSNADQKRLGEYFGKLHQSVGGSVTHSRALADDPCVRKFHFDENSTAVSGETWHTDQSCASIPPMGSILYLHTIPPNGGGDTMFASMYAAYDALSPRMKSFLEGLTAVHDGGRVFERTADNIPPVSTHPLIVKHQETGRKLIYFTGAVVTKINELPELESNALIRFLTEHCAHPNFQVRWRWSAHSIAFWDNRCTHHRAIWDYYPQTRSGYRIQVKGSGAPIPA